MEGKKGGPRSKRFTWKIENFSTLEAKRLYSETFCVGGNKWRVLIFPKGNNVDNLSIYLDVADSATLPCGWSIYAKFKLSVVSQVDSKFTVTKDRDTQHHFNAGESDWGFTTFMPLSNLNDPGKGYLLNDTCIVEAVVDCLSRDIKEESDHVELEVEATKTVIVEKEVEVPRSPPTASHSFDDMDAYISELVSVVETDAPFDSFDEGSATASINPQSTVDEAKTIFIKMLSQDLSEIPDIASHLAESIVDLSKCCDLTLSRLEELNSFMLEFITLLETYKTSKQSLKEVEEKMAEKQGTKNSLVEQVKINAFVFQTRRAIHKELLSKKAELQQEIERLQAELANISEKDKSAEKEIKGLHGKMVSLEQSRSSLLEEFSTLEAKKKTGTSTLSSLQQKWTELRRGFMEANN